MSREKPTCVVIDTNIWCSHLLLKTPLGESAVYALGPLGFACINAAVARLAEERARRILLHRHVEIATGDADVGMPRGTL